MDIYDARRKRLLALIDARYGGNRARFCEEVGLAPSYVSRMLQPGNSPSRKRIGEDLARRLESDLDLEPGELVNPLAPSDAPRPLPPPAAQVMSDEVVKLLLSTLLDLYKTESTEEERNRAIKGLVDSIRQTRAQLGLPNDEGAGDNEVLGEAKPRRRKYSLPGPVGPRETMKKNRSKKA